MKNAAIEAEGLKKGYGDVRALDGFDLAIEAGTIQGLLGPNGAGKSTAVGILSTLLQADAGRATVAGHDVRTEPHAVKQAIGLVGQSAAVDEILSGLQNLIMFGRLFGLGKRAATARAGELLELFDLAEAATRPVSGYSGGMRRRLDIAASLILAPAVLFLDEPTTGLDPAGRNGVWSSVRQAADSGTTVLLTTQYLDEADQLADRVTVMKRGRVIADDAPERLKAEVGSGRVVVRLDDPADLRSARELFPASGDDSPIFDEDRRSLTFDAREGSRVLFRIARRLDEAGFEPDDIGLRRPTLDEAFLALTEQQPDPAHATSKEAA